MTAAETIRQLEQWGSESTKKILINHGAQEPVLGVKVADLKKLQKQIKQDHGLSLELFDTGIYDAQYLAGLIADEAKLTKTNLRRWLTRANCTSISGTTVAWVTAESRFGMDLGREWIAAKKESKAHAGWMTLASLVSIKPDAELDLTEIKQWLQHIAQSIHDQPNLVRYAMNAFVISVGCYISSLTKTAIQTAKKIGTVTVDMGPTACSVPDAVAFIQKVEQRGTIGKKRKTARC